MQIVAIARVDDQSGLVRGDNVVGFENLSDGAHQEIRMRFGDTPAAAYLAALATPTSGTGETPIANVGEDDNGIFAIVTIAGPARGFLFVLLSAQ